MKKINQGFVCMNCGGKVQSAEKTCRNHCPFCFVSIHIDGQLPGDRASTCNGFMYPISYETKNQTIKIKFKCNKCGKIHQNKLAVDDEFGRLDNLIQQYKIKFI